MIYLCVLLVTFTLAYGYLGANTVRKRSVGSASWSSTVAAAGVPNLHRVDEGLFRSAQPTAEGMASLAALGIKTIVNLRHNHSDQSEIEGLPLVEKRICVNTWSIDADQARDFIRIATDEQSRPVLVHCQHGADRTGAMVALYRVLRHGWSDEDAIREMTGGGFGFHGIWMHLPDFVRRTALLLRRLNHSACRTA